MQNNVFCWQAGFKISEHVDHFCSMGLNHCYRFDPDLAGNPEHIDQFIFLNP
jgi:hypothetical protein